MTENGSFLEGFPSGQRDQTVNLTALPSKVRILPPPPRFPSGTCNCGNECRTRWSVNERCTRSTDRSTRFPVIEFSVHASQPAPSGVPKPAVEPAPRPGDAVFTQVGIRARRQGTDVVPAAGSPEGPGKAARGKGWSAARAGVAQW